MSVLNDKRILLVEDEMLLGILFEDMLQDMGMTVDGPYRTAKSALKALSNGDAPDVALLDIDLGVETSISVADALEEQSIPFIFVTGFAGAGLSGYDSKEVLGKPFTEAQLMARMRNLLEKK